MFLLKKPGRDCLNLLKNQLQNLLWNLWNLLQNLSFGDVPRWRIGLEEIAASLRDLEGWDPVEGLSWDGPTLFVSGARSDFILPEYRPAIRALFPAARFVTIKNAEGKELTIAEDIAKELAVMVDIKTEGNAAKLTSEQIQKGMTPETAFVKESSGVHTFIEGATNVREGIEKLEKIVDKDIKKRKLKS